MRQLPKPAKWSLDHTGAPLMLTHARPHTAEQHYERAGQ